MGMAGLANERGWGLLNNYEVPYAFAVILSILALDLVIYFQHLMFHAVPLLWRFHRMHHADLDFDLTTGVRFHPIEIVVSMGIKVGAVALIGPPLLGVLLFEIILNATSIFNHANWKIPLGLDRILRRVIVTPDMHRVHHSVHRDETNSNFGFNLPWWDWIFGTYRAQPREGHEQMTIGLHQFRDPRQLHLWRMFVQPFTRENKEYPINAREKTDPFEEADFRSKMSQD
jgi:sterol desaturase/sphingolipid hydroxylase (fatty acid hydroxylase superfamily)